MKNTFLILTLFLFSIDFFGQTYTIHGTVKDQTTGEALIGATISFRVDNQLKGAATNRY